MSIEKCNISLHESIMHVMQMHCLQRQKAHSLFQKLSVAFKHHHSTSLWSTLPKKMQHFSWLLIFYFCFRAHFASVKLFQCPQVRKSIPLYLAYGILGGLKPILADLVHEAGYCTPWMGCQSITKSDMSISRRRFMLTDVYMDVRDVKKCKNGPTANNKKIILFCDSLSCVKSL